MKPETQPERTLTAMQAETEHRCPTCGALLYSRKSKICGQCRAVLPVEIVLTEEEVSAHHDERQWARELANAFDITGRATNSERVKAASGASQSEEGDTRTLEETLRRMSCAAEFKHRERHTWIYVIGFVVTLLTSVEFVLFAIGGRHLMPLNGESLLVWLILGGLHALSWFTLWRNSMPICPNCRQNIRHCPAGHCHGCGKPLRQKRCTDCDVDYSWTGWLQPYRNGTFRRITFCPGCGVELCTRIYRWRAGERL
jgi:hypothetical protein